MKIHLLPSEVIDQIAAGEVVERPAHLVKELIENSIDAGASEIEIEFAEGGRWVKVIDNGSGMDKDDLSLALDRHSTSKINKTSDLWQLGTFGFRGEALASVAAVSRLTLISRSQKQETAFRIESHFGKKSEITQSGGSKGTTIIIEDLFANVPVRLKFLKTEAAEETQIKVTLKALALANPQVTFRVKSRGALVFLWQATEDILSRAQKVLEQEKLYLVQGEKNGFKVQFCYSPPHITAKSSRQMWLFAQQRWVQDRTIQAAVLEAYRNLLMHGEYPIVACWLEAKPDEIDVNIHPTKSQVKLRDTQGAFRAVQITLREALEKAPWVEATVGMNYQGLERGLPSSAEPGFKTEYNLSFQSADLDKTHFAKKQMTVMETLKIYAPEQKEREERESQEVIGKNVEGTESKHQGENIGRRWSNLDVIGQINQTYVVTQSRDSLILIDQHAAHERVVFERIMMAWRGGIIEVQDYLIPLTIDLPMDQIEVILNDASELKKIGIEIEQMGPESIGVKSAPAQLSERALAQTLEKYSHERVHRGGSMAFDRVIGDIAATLACHSVVRAGQSLSLEQMKSLLEQMDEYSFSSFCPHGRPVFVEYPFGKIERDFGRIV